jgi:hypothetical protein
LSNGALRFSPDLRLTTRLSSKGVVSYATRPLIARNLLHVDAVQEHPDTAPV